MKRDNKKWILPTERLILSILNEDNNASEDVVLFYDRYIREMATDPVYATDGSRAGYFYDEDLAQELRIALAQCLPAVRRVILERFFENNAI